MVRSREGEAAPESCEAKRVGHWSAARVALPPSHSPTTLVRPPARSLTAFQCVAKVRWRQVSAAVSPRVGRSYLAHSSRSCLSFITRYTTGIIRCGGGGCGCGAARADEEEEDEDEDADEDEEEEEAEEGATSSTTSSSSSLLPAASASASASASTAAPLRGRFAPAQ